MHGSLFTAPLGVKFKKRSMHKLQVAYNDCLQILLKNQGGVVQVKDFVRRGLTLEIKTQFLISKTVIPIFPQG